MKNRVGFSMLVVKYQHAHTTAIYIGGLS